MLRIILNVASSLGLLLGANAFAADYYVSPQGDDAAIGNEAQPWQTIQHAASTALAGDTVWVHAGVYKETGPVGNSTVKYGIVFANDGQAGQPIVFRAAPGARPIVDQDYESACFRVYGRQHIEIRGFELRECHGAGVKVAAGSGRQNAHIVVRDNLIHHIDGGAGDNVAGVRLDSVDSPVVTGNTIHHIRVDGMPNLNGAGVLSYRMFNALIENNEIFDAETAVFHKIPDPQGRFAGEFRRNLIHDVEHAFHLHTNTSLPAAGIHNGTQIYQNVVYNSGVLLYDTTYQSVTANRDVSVFNNTVVGGAQFTVRGIQGFSFYNNLMINADGILPPHDSHHSAGFTTKYQDHVYTENDRHAPGVDYLDYNLYSDDFIGETGTYSDDYVRYVSLAAWQMAGMDGPVFTLDMPDSSPDLNSFTTTDPGFVEPQSYNFRLREDSPARGAGLHGDNIGAYLSDADQIGPPPVNLFADGFELQPR